jgi:hypothetical protein
MADENKTQVVTDGATQAVAVQPETQGVEGEQ